MLEALCWLALALVVGFTVAGVLVGTVGRGC